MGIAPSAGEYFGNNNGVWEKVGTDGVTKTTLDRVKLYYDVGNITSERVTTWLEGATNRYTGSSRDFETYSNAPLDFFKVSNTSAFWSYMKLFGVKVYDSQNVLLNSFVPCYRKSDSVAGMYETVNDVFYTNQGTGSFVVGNNVYGGGIFTVPKTV